MSGVLLTTFNFTVIIAARYLLVAGVTHWLTWRRREPAGARRLNRDGPTRAAIRHELKLSLISSPIYALPAAVAIEAWKAGGTRLYTDPLQYGWAWLPLSLAVYLLVQDAFYYWAHRLMHRPGLFDWMHKGHHRSRQPTAYASFAFDPAEAALTAWLLPALTFVLPLHVGVALLGLGLMTAAAVLNHCGVEVWPQRWVGGPLGGVFITATHHSLHHTRFNANYGLYLRLWDRAFGTDVMGSKPVGVAEAPAQPRSLARSNGPPRSNPR